jgi:hypothetical protein
LHKSLIHSDFFVSENPLFYPPAIDSIPLLRQTQTGYITRLEAGEIDTPRTPTKLIKKYNMSSLLYEMLQDTPSLNITINAGQLIEAIDYCVNKTRKELEQQITDANTETYPSPDQVAKILDVDKSTLWRWRKQGYLIPIEVGGKRRYRMSDVKKILEG